MKKQHIIYLVAGIVVPILIGGGLYAYKFRDCVKKVSYVPPREQENVVPDSIAQLRQKYGNGIGASDKGDYYDFMSRKFRTSDEAIRACIWK